MNEQNFDPSPASGPSIFIVSGGLGALGEQLTHVILAQFPHVNVPVKVFSRILNAYQVEETVNEALTTGAIIVHTLSDPEVRQAMLDLTQAKGVAAFDVVGPLLEYLTLALGQRPLGKPSVYQPLAASYFQRVEAIEFTLATDDGLNYERWQQAEIVLAGVSRVGKTPLSLYLSVLGWKVANIPLVPDIPPRPEMYTLDKRRVVGLTIDPTKLLSHRLHRQRSLGLNSEGEYSDPVKIYEELEEIYQLMRKAGFRIIDVTDKPIETTADEILTLVKRRLGHDSKP